MQAVDIKKVSATWRVSKMVLSDLRVIAAIVSITILEIFALAKGIDGALLSTSIAVIAGLAGYAAGRRICIARGVDAEEEEN